MATYAADQVKIMYGSRVLTSIKGAVTPPGHREDQGGVMGVANGGVVFVVGSDKTGEAKIPVPVASGDHSYLVDVATRVLNGQAFGGLNQPILSVQDLNSGVRYAMPAIPKKIPAPDHDGFGAAAGDAPIAEWEFVGGPVSVSQVFTG